MTRQVLQDPLALELDDMTRSLVKMNVWNRNTGRGWQWCVLDCGIPVKTGHRPTQNLARAAAGSARDSYNDKLKKGLRRNAGRHPAWGIGRRGPWSRGDWEGDPGGF